MRMERDAALATIALLLAIGCQPTANPTKPSGYDSHPTRTHVAIHTLGPLRKEATQDSGITTTFQVGERFRVTEENAHWQRLESAADPTRAGWLEGESSAPTEVSTPVVTEAHWKPSARSFDRTALAEPGVLGVWDDTVPGTAWRHRIRIQKNGPKYLRISQFPLGKENRGDLVEVKPAEGKQRAFADPNSPHGEVYVIDAAGNLELYDRGGFIREARKIAYTPGT